MDRSNHYEAAFEAYLQQRQICYVVVNEAKRSLLGGKSVKSLDFIVYGHRGSRLLIDIKGRRFPGGTSEKPRRVWENWSTQDDVDGLEQWTERFGPGYRGLLVFAYHLTEDVELEDDTLDLFSWQQKQYLFRAVDIREYRQHLKVRSPRWKTVSLPAAMFRKLITPVRHFIDGPALIPDECPL